MDKDFEYIRCSDKPVFSQVTPHFEDDGKTLCLDAPGMDTLRVNLHLDKEENYIEDLKYVINYRSIVKLVFLDPCALWDWMLHHNECVMFTFLLASFHTSPTPLPMLLLPSSSSSSPPPLPPPPSS